ncbi:diiron oxygenase [Chthoniobacter flavus]|nr:diiron oxygenase [Chthoniobacter flavus]
MNAMRHATGRASAQSGPSVPEPGEAAIDFTRLFIAEVFTPLFHTRIYAGLPGAVRLRYNQLHALYFNEQIAFFEQGILSPFLLALLRRSPPVDLEKGLRVFFAEEQRHTAQFRELNLRCAPELYEGGERYFVSAPRALDAAISAAAAQPFLFPLLIWLTLLQEERSLYWSRGCLEHASELEPHFVATHRAHLADEIGHVRWDEDLLDWLWPRVGPAMRRLHAWLLRWMLGEYFLLPKRSSRRVIRQLVAEYPFLDRQPLDREMDGLKSNPAFLATLYSREVTPRAYARFAQHPEFAVLADILPALDRIYAAGFPS